VWVLLAGFLFWIPSLLLAYAVSIVCRKRERPRWASALGWITLWVVPAVVYQSAWWLSSSSSYSGSFRGVLLAAPVGLWVLLGGRSAVAVFEATARDITGHRNSTMMDNVHVYLVLVFIQCAVFVAILARRDRPRLRDPVALAIGAAFLVNALLASHWPWWGT
jgi:hypothetical protein